MFGPAGRAYVYPIHSRHCFNVVTQPAGEAAAVLIRALEPRGGLPAMRLRRSTNDLRLLSTGPGRLCQALAIDRQLDGLSLTSRHKIWIEANPNDRPVPEAIRSTTRIGVTSAHDLELRYVLSGNPFVSGPKYLRD